MKSPFLSQFLPTKPQICNACIQAFSEEYGFFDVQEQACSLPLNGNIFHKTLETRHDEEPLEFIHAVQEQVGRARKMSVEDVMFEYRQERHVQSRAERIISCQVKDDEDYAFLSKVREQRILLCSASKTAVVEVDQALIALKRLTSTQLVAYNREKRRLREYDRRVAWKRSKILKQVLKQESAPNASIPETKAQRDDEFLTECRAKLQKVVAKRKVNVESCKLNQESIIDSGERCKLNQVTIIESRKYRRKSWTLDSRADSDVTLNSDATSNNSSMSSLVDEIY